MPDVVLETGYYVNARLPCIALIAKGVPFPPGNWIRVADASFPAWRVEDLVPDMFPALREKPLPFVQLLTDFDVAEFQAVAMPR